MAKIIYYDLETTGTDVKLSSIRQISGLIEIDGKVVDNFDYLVKPIPKNLPEYPNRKWVDDRMSIDGVIYDKGAIEMMKTQGLSYEIIQTYEDSTKVYNDLTKKLLKYVDKYNKKDKFHLIGFNNRFFDDPFFRVFFIENGDNYFGSYFWADSIDALCLASHALMNQRTTMVDFKLMTVAKQLGIDVDETKLHEATYDLYLTKLIYEKTQGAKL